MIFYADTSFLFSLFAPDANSDQAARARSILDGPLSLSPLSELELGNAISLAVFQRRVDQPQAALLRRRIKEDFASGALVKKNVIWEAAFSEAAKLSVEQTPDIGCRSLDLLQVAIAKTIAADVFLSFDNRQRTAAMQAGLNVQP